MCLRLSAGKCVPSLVAGGDVFFSSCVVYQYVVLVSAHAGAQENVVSNKSKQYCSITTQVRMWVIRFIHHSELPYMCKPYMCLLTGRCVCLWPKNQSCREDNKHIPASQYLRWKRPPLPPLPPPLPLPLPKPPPRPRPLKLILIYSKLKKRTTAETKRECG